MGRRSCPFCRDDIYDQVPQQILDEVALDRLDHANPDSLGSRPRRNGDDGYDTADEIESDATHFKIRVGAREVAFMTNDGTDKEISIDLGEKSFRIEYKNRKCYLRRKNNPDIPVPLNPLAPQCAALPPPPPFTTTS